MKKITTLKKLAICKTTLRVLASQDLREIAGGTQGGTWTACSGKCSIVYCDSVDTCP